jgi:hypothetical protein
MHTFIEGYLMTIVTLSTRSMAADDYPLGVRPAAIISYNKTPSNLGGEESRPHQLLTV